LSARHKLEYFLLVGFAALVRALPRNLAIALGSATGAAGRLFQPRRVTIARDNLRQALPEIPDAEREDILKKNFRHLGISFIEMLRLDLFSGQRDMDRYFSFEGLENLHEAISLGRGCIMLSGHVGFWEAGAFFLPQLGVKTAFVAKPMRNQLVDAYFCRMRSAFGCYQVSSRKGARRIIKALQNNHMVGILMDQHTTPKTSVRVPFFGRPAYTTPVVAQIAMKLQTPVLPSFVYRTADNRYRVRFEPLIILDAGEMNDADVLHNTTYLTDRIEQGIRREISQWFWVHRRWRDKKPTPGTPDETNDAPPATSASAGSNDAP